MLDQFRWLGALAMLAMMSAAVPSFTAGYRALGQDYDSGSGRYEFAWDVVIMDRFLPSPFGSDDMTTSSDP